MRIFTVHVVWCNMPRDKEGKNRRKRTRSAASLSEDDGEICEKARKQSKQKLYNIFYRFFPVQKSSSTAVIFEHALRTVWLKKTAQ